MVIDKIVNEGNPRLILIFSGWSTDKDFYASLCRQGWDIAVVTAYDDISSLKNKSALDQYATICVVAWSLGVAMAEWSAKNGLLPLSAIAAAYAVNGTLHPVSDTYGIPEDIYEGTRKNLDLRNLKAFRRRMTSRRDLFYPMQSQTDASEEDLEILRNELKIIRDAAQTLDSVITVLPWKRAFISDNDLIFPASNQERAWMEIPDIIRQHMPAGHYVPMLEIVKYVTPDNELIAEKFSKSLESYDSNAVAQRHIAQRLATMIESVESFDGDSLHVLEIGQGSGLFARWYMPRLRRLYPSAKISVDFVDLYATPCLGLADEENYHVANAEDWILKCESARYDMVTSSCAMQWFVHPERFIANVKRVLRPEAIFIASTFIKGNLKELDLLRPAPIAYLSADSLEKILSASFADYSIEEDEISLSFESSREMLKHLRQTGVTATPASTPARLLFTSLPAHPTLTYATAYLKARRL